MTELPWVAHEFPERPLQYGCWVCECPKCSLAVQATGLTYPNLTLVVKWSDVARQAIGWNEYLITDFSKEESATHYVREIFVKEGTGYPT